ncbi:MAG: SH3-like domain-containing protein [Dinoroseobacter sp.]|jgi:SH3-like domain-containing protein
MKTLLPLTASLCVAVFGAMVVWPASDDRISAIRAPLSDAAPAPAAYIVPPSAMNTAVITGQRVNFRSGPSPYFKIHYAMSFGSVVEVLSEPDTNWVELRDLSTGQVGFMAATYVLKDAATNG